MKKIILYFITLKYRRDINSAIKILRKCSEDDLKTYIKWVKLERNCFLHNLENGRFTKKYSKVVAKEYPLLKRGIYNKDDAIAYLQELGRFSNKYKITVLDRI